MTLFGTGIGEAADAFCCVPVLGGIGATAATAIAGVMRRSAGFVAVSFLLAALAGAVVVTSAATHELRDTDDSRGVHAMGWQFVEWWAYSLCAPFCAAVALVLGWGPAPGRKLSQTEVHDPNVCPRCGANRLVERGTYCAACFSLPSN